jgi:LysR family carnitine catabolism transcriptional activator
MNLTQRQLRMFVATASTGNISRASEALHISQPALTRGLQEFESQLGVSLFQRTTRRLSLTHEGERFLPVAQRLLSDMELATTELKQQVAGLRGAVAVAVGTAFGCTVLPEVLRQFSASHPGVTVRLIDDNSQGITARVSRAEVDFGIGSPVGDSGPLLCHRLLSAPLGLLANEARHPLTSFEQDQDLSALPLLKESADTSIMHMLRTHGSDIVSQMGQGIEVSSLALQLAFAQQGLGVAVVSALGASHPMAQGMHFVPVRPAILRDVFTIQRRDRAPSPSARALMQAVGLGLQRVQLHPAVRIAVSPD